MGNICFKNQLQNRSSPLCKYDSSKASTESSDSICSSKSLAFLPRQEEAIRFFEATHDLPSPSQTASLSHVPQSHLILSGIGKSEELEAFKEAKSLRFLSEEEVKGYIKYFFELAVEVIPSLAAESSDPFLRKEIWHYQNILRSQKEEFIRNQVSWVMKTRTSICKEDFLAQLKFMDWLLSPHKLREDILIYNKNAEIMRSD